jgi:hypothetical protein
VSTAVARLAELLEQRGDLERAAQILHALTAAGDWTVAERLAPTADQAKQK